MKVANVVPLLLTVLLLPAPTFADDFPQDYIRKQLESAKTPIRVYLQKLEPGQQLIVEYVGHPILVYRRTTSDLAYLKQGDMSLLVDPTDKNMNASLKAAYGSSSSLVWARLLMVSQPRVTKMHFRSLQDEFLVVGGWGPQSGCALRFDTVERRQSKHAAIYDPCVNAAYDASGRVLKGKLGGRASGQYALFNLYIPPHHFASDSELVIGVPPSQSIPVMTTQSADLYKNQEPTERLMTAARYNDIEAARKAIKDGAKADFYVEGKGSPLDAAIIGSSMELITLLVKNGARPTPNSRNAAAFVNRREVIELISRLEGK